MRGVVRDFLCPLDLNIRRRMDAEHVERHDHDRPEKSPELIRLIRSHGYRLFWHRPPHR